MAILVEPDAATDLAQAFAEYDACVRGMGGEFFRGVRAALSLVQRRPEQFARVHGEIRRVLLRQLPHAIYYIAESGQATVVAVVHHREHARRGQPPRG
jgi:plasmid stabilization system protein ParE